MGRQSYYADSVYVIAGSHGLVKIGVSREPGRRLAELQTGSPYHLHLAHSMMVTGNAYDAEMEAHAILARYRQQGEWFAVPIDVAVAAVSAAVFRRCQPAANLEGAPERPTRWLLWYILITMVATPVWTFQTPIAFVALSFFGICVMTFQTIHHEPSVGTAARWAGLVIMALATSLVLASPFVTAKAAEEQKIITLFKNHRTKDGSTISEVISYAEEMRSDIFKAKNPELGYNIDHKADAVCVGYWIGKDRTPDQSIINLCYKIISDGKTVDFTPWTWPTPQALEGGKAKFLEDIDETYELFCSNTGTHC